MAEIMRGRLASASGEKIEIAFKMPTRALNNSAFELAKSAESKGEGAVLIEASLNQARLSLCEVGGRAVTFRELQGEGLNKHLDPLQIETFLAALQRLTTASEAEVLFAESSATAIVGSEGAGVYKRRVLIPTTGAPREDGSFAARAFTFKMPTRNTLQKAHEAARNFEKSGALVVASEAELNMIRMCLLSIEELRAEEPAPAAQLDEEGAEEAPPAAPAPASVITFKRVEPWAEELRGDGIDRYLSQREQSCLAQVFRRLSTPDRPKVDDFLSSLVSA